MSTAAAPKRYSAATSVSVASERCAYCKGSGCMPESRVPCHAFLGRGTVQVTQPSTTCPKCKGLGRVHDDRHMARCLTCLGTGWLRTDLHLFYGLL